MRFKNRREDNEEEKMRKRTDDWKGKVLAEKIEASSSNQQWKLENGSDSSGKRPYK